jgi:hypothetical protein
MDQVTNKAFAANDQEFKTACQHVGLSPTAKQASKFRNRKGLAFLYTRFGTGLDLNEFKRKLTQIKGRLNG